MTPPNIDSRIAGINLEADVPVCRALVRTSGGSMQRRIEVLAGHGLAPAIWERVSAARSSRIRAHGAVHAEFGRLCAGALDTGGEI